MGRSPMATLSWPEQSMAASAIFERQVIPYAPWPTSQIFRAISHVGALKCSACRLVGRARTSRFWGAWAKPNFYPLGGVIYPFLSFSFFFLLFLSSFYYFCYLCYFLLFLFRPFCVVILGFTPIFRS